MRDDAGPCHRAVGAGGRGRGAGGPRDASGGGATGAHRRGRSEVADLEQALGRFVLYRGILHRSEPGRQMVLAVPRSAWTSLFESELGRTAREEFSLVVVVFDPVREEVWQWFR